MQSVNKKAAVLLICLVSVLFSTGCTNWEKKYRVLNVTHQNTLGLLERARTEKGQFETRFYQDQQTIEELQRKIAEGQDTGIATGFGGDYEVDYDPRTGVITVTLESAILFSAGKATLRKATIAELDHIYSVFRDKYSDKKIDIIGHTDSDPIKKSKWKDNWELSAQRALTVVRYFVKKGIAENQIRGVGSGAARPVASNSTTSGKAKNRRVEIAVYLK